MSLLRRLSVGRALRTATANRWSSTASAGRKAGDEADARPKPADKDDSVKVEPDTLNFPSAEPYLHLRLGRKNLICTNEKEVNEAKKRLPGLFKVRMDDTGVFRAPKYRGRTRKALRNRVLAAGRVMRSEKDESLCGGVA